MKISLLARRLGLAGLGCALALPALHAVAQSSNGPYVGLGVGSAQARIDENRVSSTLLGQGFTTTTVSSDRSSTAYKLFGGWKLGRNMAVEAGYFDLGRSNFSATALPAGALTGEFKVRGFNADLVGLLPITDSFSGLARVGVSRAETRSNFAGSGGVTIGSPERSQQANNAKWGLGLQYALGASMIVRAEAERYRITDTLGTRADVNVATLSLLIPFGGGGTAPRAAAAPAYVVTQAPAPAPAPMPMPAPPPAMPEPVVVAPPAPVAAAPVVLRQVSYNAESIFSFDHSDLRPEGRQALDGFARELTGTTYSEILVEGHTDRLGSVTYNQTLSEQRADVVKSYLVMSGQIDPGKIRATGRGETSPVTQPSDCVGTSATAKLVACLQPDRRVQIDVVGTR